MPVSQRHVFCMLSFFLNFAIPLISHAKHYSNKKNSIKWALVARVFHICATWIAFVVFEKKFKNEIFAFPLLLTLRIKSWENIFTFVELHTAPLERCFQGVTSLKTKVVLEFLHNLLLSFFFSIKSTNYDIENKILIRIFFFL